MSDINTYANELLLDFLDASHDSLQSTLMSQFGDTWFRDGIEKHLHPRYLERTRQMLNSPMAIIDMKKTDEELYGVEHLANIVTGNWQLFKQAFQTRERTQVYFGEIAELRHNISHRRKRHMLSMRELLRFVDNSTRLLGALRSPLAQRFESIATSLEQGDFPWGAPLHALLPPVTEIVSDFVGRMTELRKLSTWLTDEDNHYLMIWGYGGSGKSALAYQFARAVRDGAPPDLEAVVWLSAKKREYVEGKTQDRPADFHDLESFCNAFWYALYGAEPSPSESTPIGVVKELNQTPLLMIIDDLDSILDNSHLSRFLLYEIRGSVSRIVYTSRQRLPGLETIEVRGFNTDELSPFVRSRANEYGLIVDDCLDRLNGIHRVTNGFPLFVDDLLRHAKFTGLVSAIEDWSQRRGDAAREYSLRRQLSSLGDAGQLVLIATAVARRPVSSYELSTVCGFTDDDVQHAIQDLLNWRLLSRLQSDDQGHPTFSCNTNTRRLVEKTYSRNPKYRSYRESFSTLIGSVKPARLRRAVGIAISSAHAAVLRGDSGGAEEVIREAMTGELSDNADLWSMLGWVLSRSANDMSLERARKAFSRSHNRGSRKEDTYYHWARLESSLAERMVDSGDEEEILKQWRKASEVAKLGIRRCGDTPTLCGDLAYLRIREGQTLERLNNFTAAQHCFRRSAEWARRALVAPNPSSREVQRGRLYRSRIFALGMCDDYEAAVKVLEEWQMLVGNDDPEWYRFYERLAEIPAYQGVLL